MLHISLIFPSSHILTLKQNRAGTESLLYLIHFHHGATHAALTQFGKRDFLWTIM